MAYIKALLFLAVAVACATADEEAPREKKQVLYGSPYTAFKYTDDGKYYPGKYETPVVPVARVAGVPVASVAGVPAAYPYAYSPYVAGQYYY